MKPLPISLALLLLFTLGAAHAAPSRTADARQLLRVAEAGHAHIVKAAQATQGRLDRSRPEQRLFWNAVDKMEAALRRVRSGMTAAGGTFFQALEDGSTALGELRVVWARTGVADPHVSKSLRILSSAYDLLRTGYGREAVRHRQGGGLTEDERQRFLRIQQAQHRFAKRLEELQEIARKRGDEALLAELRRMAEEAERIAMAQLTLDAYLNALMIGDAQRGEWAGNSLYAAPADRAEWQAAETEVEELYTEEEVGHVFALDLGNLGDAAAPVTLTHFEEPTELPDSLLAEAAEIDLVEEEEALFEEEMEEVADSDLEVVEEIVEEEGEEEAVEEEGEETVEKATDGTEVKSEEKAGEKAEAKPAEAAAPKKEPAPAPGKKDSKKDSKKKSARPPA